MSLGRDIIKIAKRAVRAILSEEIHTHLPAQVISYDASTNLCSVQPCLNKIRTADPSNQTIQLPVLEDVPVMQFGSGKCLLSIAPQEGSYGLLHVSERALANWIEEGGIVTPERARMFDISDCFFDPGAYPTVSDGDNGKVDNGIETDRVELRTRTRTAFISVVDDDTVEMDGTTIDVGGSSEPAMQGSKFQTKYNTHTHSTAFGPSGTPIVQWSSADMSSKVRVG